MSANWTKFEPLLYGEVPISIVNEPIEPIDLTALDVARRRWRCEPKLISGDHRERE